MEKNSINELNSILFDTIRRLKEGDSTMDIARAKTIADVGQTIINSGKTQIDFLRMRDKAEGLVAAPELFNTDQKTYLDK
jgi:hypothetical protein